MSAVVSKLSSEVMHVAREDLGLYVAGELADIRLAEIERHVSSCPRCEALLQEEARLELAFEEIARRPAAIESAPPRLRPMRGRVVVMGVATLALAAAWAFFFTVPRLHDARDPSPGAQPEATATSSAPWVELASDASSVSSARDVDGG